MLYNISTTVCFYGIKTSAGRTQNISNMVCGLIRIFGLTNVPIVYPITKGRSVIAGLNSISNRMVSIPQRFDC